LRGAAQRKLYREEGAKPGVAEAGPERDVVLIWLPSGRKGRLSDFTQGETFDDLESAVTRAMGATSSRGMLPWVCCDKKFVLSPEDISMAHAQFKER
jgi:hypothetical protein